MKSHHAKKMMFGHADPICLTTNKDYFYPLAGVIHHATLSI